MSVDILAASPTHNHSEQLSERASGVSDRVALMLITCGWAALAVIVNPIGEMILNDDGAYAYAVKSILETGSLKLSAWGSPNLVAQAYWGALFCWPFGFSHTALRLSTLTLALTALLALYILMRETGAASMTALFGVLVLALNPLFFELSFTFMTDVPFLAFTLVATYLLIRGIKRQSGMELGLGLLAATAALLTRQTGLALFFALSLTYLVKNGLNWRNVTRAAAPALLGLGVQFSYHTWLKMTGRMAPLFGKPAAAAFDVESYAMKQIASNAVFALIYVGLFVLPLLLFIGFRRLSDLWRKQRRIATLTSIVFFAVAAFPLLRHHRMPFLLNVLYDSGLGPPTIRYDIYPLPSAGPVFWTAVTVIGIVSAALVLQILISAVLRLLESRAHHQELLLLFVMGAIYFSPLPFLPAMYDRYLLPLVPIAIVVSLMICSTGNTPSQRWTALGVLCLLLYGGFAIAGTHDYLAWQRTRWQALRTLTVVRHIRPEQIDGGFEFNLTYRTPGGKIPIGDDLVVAFGPAPGYAEAERYTYRRWMPPGEGTVLVLRKILPQGGGL